MELKDGSIITMSSEAVYGSQPFPLLEFPNEILLRAASHLEAPDISSLMLTNRHFAGLFKIALLQAASSYVPAHCSLASPGRAVLKWAVSHGRCALAGELLDIGGSKINLNDPLIPSFNVKPLNLARSSQMVQFLLDRGASVTETWRCSPLIAGAGKYSVELTKFWLEKGVDVNATVDGYMHGRTLLHTYADEAQDELYYTTLEETMEIIEMLLEHGADVNRGECDGNTPLHLMALISQKDVLSYLESDRICNGINNGYSALELLFSPAGFACVKLLLRYGADPSRENRVRETFLALCHERLYMFGAPDPEVYFQEVVEEIERLRDPGGTGVCNSPPYYSSISGLDPVG